MLFLRMQVPHSWSSLCPISRTSVERTLYWKLGVRASTRRFWNLDRPAIISSARPSATTDPCWARWRWLLLRSGSAAFAHSPQFTYQTALSYDMRRTSTFTEVVVLSCAALSEGMINNGAISAREPG